MIPRMSHLVFRASIVAAEMTEFIPGAGLPPHRIPSLTPPSWDLNLRMSNVIHDSPRSMVRQCDGNPIARGFLRKVGGNKAAGPREYQ